MADIWVENFGVSNFVVLRPVPQPSSVIVLGEVLGRFWKAWLRSVGMRRSSMAWRMLPSVS